MSQPDQATETAGTAAATVITVCPSCGEETLPGELFCENCGADLHPGAAAGPAAAQSEVAGEGEVAGESTAAMAVPVEDRMSPTCRNCGGTDFADGYCSTCGTPAVRERDHWTELPAPWVAAVCDRGIRHHRNEDAVAVSAGSEPGGTSGSTAVLVVCDGVSSSADSDVASLAAARAARDVLCSQLPDSPSNAGRISAWTKLLGRAADAANAQVVAVAASPTGRTSNAGRSDGPPSCTFVAAVVDGPLVVVGSVGDSRAYWVPDSGLAEQLSVDDSWASEQIQLGMPREEAEHAPQAHAITRWLGADSPDHQPRCTSLTPSGPGWLVLCSDGLWNYSSDAADLATLVRGDTSAQHDPLALSTRLTDWANEQGGQDNITVAVARLNAANQPELQEA